ncbi:hypothetical protein CMI45_01145 [Candidatus Pacearchaeota archaeon]|nr:hypothetical protein [Candidatus Pacearchaeota archaeon]|tara:strand:- start:9710 stop:10405 length:696 start_codon:yes stop_codon:yes gene_type:complete
MKQDSSTIFSDKTQEACVEEIISTLKNDDLPQSSFKVDFKLSKGKMVSEEEHNTVLSFDTKNNTSLRGVLDFICEVEDVDENDIKSFEEFRQGLIGKLNSSGSQDKLKEIIREKVFQDASKDAMPIGKLNIIDVEISDLPEVDYVLVIKKMAPPNYQVESVSDDLFQEHSNTSEDFEDIIKRKKDSGDIRYKYVDGVEKRKTFFEITIPIYADYSLQEVGATTNDSPVESE